MNRGTHIAPIAVAVGLSLAALGCAGSDRPALIDGERLQVDAATVAATLAPAPDGTRQLRVPDTLANQPAQTDAVVDWLAVIGADVRGSCDTKPTADDGSMCSVDAIDRPNVVYLGPDESEVWHVVVVAESDSGYRVASTAVAGP